MKHQVLLTDKIQAIAEELARERPKGVYYGHEYEAWKKKMEAIDKALGEPEGFLKICYKEDPETIEKICRTCRHRTKTFSHCFKFNMHPELAWLKCQGKEWE